MNNEDVKARLVGRKIVEVEADFWDNELGWLNSFASVIIELDDGTKLDSIGEPIGISFPASKD